jgi:hypothetical protein
MTKTTTNLLGILISILAGTYFNLMYCASCEADGDTLSASLYASEAACLTQAGIQVSGVTLILANRLISPDKLIQGEHNDTVLDRSAETHTNQP